MRSGNTEAANMLRAIRSFLGENDMMAYITMMAVRLIELHRVLKPNQFGNRNAGFQGEDLVLIALVHGQARDVFGKRRLERHRHRSRARRRERFGLPAFRLQCLQIPWPVALRPRGAISPLR
jgi:hypothetical protein